MKLGAAWVKFVEAELEAREAKEKLDNALHSYIMFKEKDESNEDYEKRKENYVKGLETMAVACSRKTMEASLTYERIRAKTMSLEQLRLTIIPLAIFIECAMFILLTLHIFGVI